MLESKSLDKTEAFESIYNRYYISVYRFFIKRLSVRELCEDLTSEVFYSCLKNYERYDPDKASVATWIFTVANNKLKNHYRDRKETTSIDDMQIHGLLLDKTDMDGAVYLTQMREHLDAALETVSERERSIIKLKYYSNLTSDQIAEQMGITSVNVRVILTRALKKLAKHFEENGIKWE